MRRLVGNFRAALTPLQNLDSHFQSPTWHFTEDDLRSLNIISSRGPLKRLIGFLVISGHEHMGALAAAVVGEGKKESGLLAEI
jgi:hypothetical protein